MKKSFSINDPIHSRIPLTQVEQSVIEHRMFQRLRRVKALGLLEKVFPSARHSRFEHSIGACHVAGKILSALPNNQREISNLDRWEKLPKYRPWQGLPEFLRADRIQQIRLAALLHDVGHGPFSHASEEIMPTRTELLDANAQHRIPKYLTDGFIKKSSKEESDKADHEDYSALMAWKILTDVTAQYDFLDESYVQNVLAFKFSTVLPSNPANKAEFDLFRNFVDGSFDSDRMDYLLRDSYFCGVPYGKYDLERLLEGIFVLESDTEGLVLGIKETSLSAFEDFLFARFQMQSQVYSHRIDSLFNSALTTMINNNAAEECKLPSEIIAYAEVDDDNFLFSEHITTSQPLKNLILWREKWSLIYEYSTQDNKLIDKIFKAIKDEIGGEFCSIVNRNPKRLRNEEILQIPVVKKDRLTKRISTDELHQVAQVLANSNPSFVYKRIFVHPTFTEIASQIAHLVRTAEEKAPLDKAA